MKRTAALIVICVTLSLIFIPHSRDAEAARVYVENIDASVKCDYDIALWYTDQSGNRQKTAPIYLAYGSNYTFDTGTNPPYMLDHSMCKTNPSTGRYLMRRWIDSIPGDSQWKIEASDFPNSIYNRKQ